MICRFGLGLTGLFVFSFCSPTPGDYVKNAREALEDEDALQAVFYFQKAYESSLRENFFIADKDKAFSGLDVSSDQKHLVLVRSSKEESDFIYKNLKEDEEISENVEGKIKDVNISSQGGYILFTTLLPGDKTCRLIIWQSDSDEFIREIEGLNCKDRPAVSERGIALFMREGKINYLDFSKSQSETALWTNKTPEKPFKNQKAKAFFMVSSDGKPFLNYGIAGSYKLYNLSGRTLKLLSKEGSFSKIFFIGQKPHPGVITGGASRQKISFFNTEHYNRVIKKYEIAAWKDITFINEKNYYFIQSGRLHLIRDGKDTPLPFLARRIFAKSNGDVVFLSAIGTAMKYDGSLPGKLSQIIFNKALDIEESK